MVPSRRDFGETIKNTVSTARSFVTKEMGNEYKEVDNLMKDMRSIHKMELDDFGELQKIGRARPGSGESDQFVLKDGQAVGVANTINAAINETAILILKNLYCV